MISLGQPLVILPKSVNFIGKLKVHLEICAAIKSSVATLDSVYFWNDSTGDNYIKDIIFVEGKLKYQCVIFSDFNDEPIKREELLDFEKKHLSLFCKKCQKKLIKYEKT